MKAITVRQPWASLIAAGVKSIETRPRRTSYRGRIAIHAGATQLHHGVFFMAARAAYTAGKITADDDARYRRFGVPFGAVVGSAVITDCLPIVEWVTGRNDCIVIDGDNGDPTLVSHPDDHRGPLLQGTGQAPFGDFTPGRWALLLDDIAPTTERCPWCWGELLYGNWYRCPVCDGEGLCDSVPARGQQAVPWEWTP